MAVVVAQVNPLTEQGLDHYLILEWILVTGDVIVVERLLVID